MNTKDRKLITQIDLASLERVEMIRNMYLKSSQKNYDLAKISSTLNNEEKLSQSPANPTEESLVISHFLKKSDFG